MSKPTYKNYLKVVIILGIIAYIIMFVYTFFVQDIETLVLESGVVEETNICDGIITRSEEVVTLNVKEKISPLVLSGERVSKGQVLATIENEKVKAIEESINKLNEEIGNIATPSSFNSDIKKLDSEINNLLGKMITQKGY
jgi:multidrug efflux pump subunit AcrA (membrane-fusion protein)